MSPVPHTKPSHALMAKSAQWFLSKMQCFGKFGRDVPEGFPSQPWVLYSTWSNVTGELYINRLDTKSVPGDSWYKLNLLNLESSPHHVPEISVRITGKDEVRIACTERTQPKSLSGSADIDQTKHHGHHNDHKKHHSDHKKHHNDHKKHHDDHTKHHDDHTTPGSLFECMGGEAHTHDETPGSLFECMGGEAPFERKETIGISASVSAFGSAPIDRAAACCGTAREAASKWKGNSISWNPDLMRVPTVHQSSIILERSTIEKNDKFANFQKFKQMRSGRHATPKSDITKTKPKHRSHHKKHHSHHKKHHTEDIYALSEPRELSEPHHGHHSHHKKHHTHHKHHKNHNRHEKEVTDSESENEAGWIEL